MNKQAELISIGNELLCGRTVNTHAQTLGKALFEIGFQLIRDTTIPDELPIIGKVTHEAIDRAPFVFITGGLGPTSDDITRDALSVALNQKIVLHSPTVQIIEQRMLNRGRKINEAAKRQALILENATVLPNSVGAAPGQMIQLPNQTTLFILPGPPNEFDAILAEEIIPKLKARFPDSHPDLIRIIKTGGVGEAEIVALLEKEKFQPLDISLGFYPANGQVEIRLTASFQCLEQIQTAETQIKHYLASFISPKENTK